MEVLATLAVGSIITMLAAPRVVSFRDGAAVRAARMELAATAEAARGAAMQRGRTARFIVRGDSVTAVVDTGPPGLASTGTQVVLRTASFKRDYNVRIVLVNQLDSSVAYDGRGIANPRLGRVARYAIVGLQARDSVCIASMGTILPNRCAP